VRHCALGHPVLDFLAPVLIELRQATKAAGFLDRRPFFHACRDPVSAEQADVGSNIQIAPGAISSENRHAQFQG
jgi:hypothetical protein